MPLMWDDPRATNSRTATERVSGTNPNGLGGAQLSRRPAGGAGKPMPAVITNPEPCPCCAVYCMLFWVVSDCKCKWMQVITNPVPCPCCTGVRLLKCTVLKCNVCMLYRVQSMLNICNFTLLEMTRSLNSLCDSFVWKNPFQLVACYYR